MAGPLRSQGAGDGLGRLRVHEHAGAGVRAPHRTDHPPAGGQRGSRREGRHEGMVLAAGEHPRHRVHAQRGAPLADGWLRIGEVRAAGPAAGVLVDGQQAEEAARAVGAKGTGHAHFG